MNSEQLYQQLMDLKPYLEKEYSVSKLGVFGSFVDGSYTVNSDVDIIVEITKPIGWKFLSLEIFLEKQLGRKIDLVTKEALKFQIKEQILASVRYL